MKHRNSLPIKAAVPLLLSAALFCMPAGAFAMNKGNAMYVKAQDSTTEDDGKETEGTQKTAGSEETEGTGKDSTQVCSCTGKCTKNSRNEECGICREDYRQCSYVEPNVRITITTPEGWQKDTAKVYVSVSDVRKSGNFKTAQIQAKIGQNGSWTDITEDNYIGISENCTVYVQVTDQNGNTYEKNRYIKCFDFTKPTLNAAVSDGLLSIIGYDGDSGVKAVYVNGYEFTKLTNGTLNIRLQQFDTGYQYFSIQAMDNAGNVSEVYQTANPYYKDPEAEDDGTEADPAEQLPVSAEASQPASASASVTEHTKTDSSGNTISGSSAGSGSSGQGDSTENAGTDEEKGKEFYTIQTANEKTFYLVIDRDGNDETVYFLTEISENDLLNVTTDNAETLPKNSAALESAIPVSAGALSNNNGGELETGDHEEQAEESRAETEEEPAGEKEETEKADNSQAACVIMGIAAAAVIGCVYFAKSKKKNENFSDDEEDDGDDYDDYETEDEEEESSPDEEFLKESEDEDREE